MTNKPWEIQCPENLGLLSGVLFWFLFQLEDQQKQLGNTFTSLRPLMQIQDLKEFGR